MSDSNAHVAVTVLWESVRQNRVSLSSCFVVSKKQQIKSLFFFFLLQVLPLSFFSSFTSHLYPFFHVLKRQSLLLMDHSGLQGWEPGWCKKLREWTACHANLCVCSKVRIEETASHSFISQHSPLSFFHAAFLCTFMIICRYSNHTQFFLFFFNNFTLTVGAHQQPSG